MKFTNMYAKQRNMQWVTYINRRMPIGEGNRFVDPTGFRKEFFSSAAYKKADSTFQLHSNKANSIVQCIEDKANDNRLSLALQARDTA